MTKHEVVSEVQWIEARRALLAEEKAFTRERDHLSKKRRAEMFLPVYSWLDVVPNGRNETKNGNLTDWVRRHDRYENDGRTLQANPAMADAS